MAVATDLMQSYQQSDVNDVNVAEGIHMISPTDTPLQLMFPKIQTDAVLNEWIEDSLTGQTSSLSVTVANTTTDSITVASGDGTDKFPEDVATYQAIIRIDEEFMLVTAMSSDVATVTRGHGSTTAATHAADAVVHIVSIIETEGADAKKAFARVRTRPSNYVQTFSRTVEVSGVQEAIKQLGGITSELSYQLLQSMKQLALELEKTIIMGVASAVGAAATPRTMAGLWSLITTNRTTDSGAIDTDAIETDIKTIWDAGGNPTTIVTTGGLAQDIANLYSDRIRTDVQTTLGGAAITSIINPLGMSPIAIIPHRMVLAGAYYMLDTTRIGLGFIRPFNQLQIARTGDSDKREIVGDYTLQLMNEAAHCYRRGFS